MPRVLCFEDDEVDRHFVSASLPEFDVDFACTLKEVKSFKKYALVIIDINLVEEDGYEIYSEIRQKVLCPVVITSGLFKNVDIALESSDTIIGKDNLQKFLKRWGKSWIGSQMKREF